MIRTAHISTCGRYRYSLTREWNASLPRLSVVMLNPSTADADNDDQTIMKLFGFCERLGFGGFRVVNLFAFRATKPADMLAAENPIGHWNDISIITAIGLNAKTLCAWGANAGGTEREKAVKELLFLYEADTYALRINSDGTPAHPLMLPYSCELQRFAV